MKSKSIVQTPILILNTSLAILWIYQGLIPKLIFQAADEQRLWQSQGIDEIVILFLIQISGYIEIIFGLLFLILSAKKALHYLNILGMLGLTILVLITDLSYFHQAFNPFVMNFSMIMLSVIAIKLIRLQQSLIESH